MDNRSRVRLPSWTTHPGFGALLLLALAVLLIAHGEPQPSTRPSGTSVGVSGTATAAGTVPPLLFLRDGRVELRRQGSISRLALPSGALPRAVITGRGLSVVLAIADDRQRAFAVDHAGLVHDLGPADAVTPAVAGSAAVIIETAVFEPGSIPAPSPSVAASGTPGATATPNRSRIVQPELRDFTIRHYDSSARQLGPVQYLPVATRMAADTAVGLTVWQPVNRVFDAGSAQESLSAAASLIRPDGTLRALGPVHPLVADATTLLVWDVAARRFGVMPLRYVTSTATSTVTASSSGGPTGSPATESAGGSPSPTPTAVAGVRWFLPTRGMLLVTGPASFAPDGSAFAVYAQVGNRRRLVVAELQNLGTDQVQVLALAQPLVKPTVSPSGSPTLVSPSNTTSTSASRSSTASAAPLEPDGYPIPAPQSPLWWNSMVVGVGTDGTLIGYKPGGAQSALLDLGLTDVGALAVAP